MVIVAYSAGAFVMPFLARRTRADPDRERRDRDRRRRHLCRAARPFAQSRAVTRPRPLAGSREVDLFAGLPPAGLETAMRAATIRDVAAGTIIIRQGEEADFFYVIDEGRVEVTQTAGEGAQPRVLRQMGAGEVFGEIGLLRGVPRTATVTAMTKVTLAVLDKEAFLELVSSGSGLTYRLLDLHRGGIQPAEG